jgi:hypothetical protein
MTFLGYGPEPLECGLEFREAVELSELVAIYSEVRK